MFEITIQKMKKDLVENAGFLRVAAIQILKPILFQLNDIPSYLKVIVRKGISCSKKMKTYQIQIESIQNSLLKEHDPPLNNYGASRSQEGGYSARDDNNSSKFMYNQQNQGSSNSRFFDKNNEAVNRSQSSSKNNPLFFLNSIKISRDNLETLCRTGITICDQLFVKKLQKFMYFNYFQKSITTDEKSLGILEKMISSIANANIISHSTSSSLINFFGNTIGDSSLSLFICMDKKTSKSRTPSKNYSIFKIKDDTKFFANHYTKEYRVALLEICIKTLLEFEDLNQLRKVYTWLLDNNL